MLEDKFTHKNLTFSTILVAKFVVVFLLKTISCNVYIYQLLKCFERKREKKTAHKSNHVSLISSVCHFIV